jgi:hypothetical protein
MDEVQVVQTAALGGTPLIIGHESADAHTVTWSSLRHDATLTAATSILAEVK